MMKYLKVFAICMLVNKIHGLRSYQSIINADGRPILRTALGGLGSPTQAESESEAEPKWLGNMRARIERLVSRHGYEAAKPYIKKTVENTERKHSVLLDVRVERDGESAITYKHNNNKPKGSLRTKIEDSVSKPPLVPENDKWVEDVEKLVVAVLESYAKDQVEKQLKPAISAIEKQKNIKIQDIDVTFNPDGKVEVEIKQVEPKSKKPLRKPHSSNSRKQKWKEVTVMFE